MKVYQIKNWSKTFENNKSRERESCGFVCVPNKQHGMGMANILSRPNGAAIYGIWCLIIGAVSRQKKPRNGWLTQDGHQTGTPWTPSAMALLWRRSVEEIEEALEIFTSQEVGWMDAHDFCETRGTLIDKGLASSARQVPAKCPPSAPSRASEEEKRLEENNPLPPLQGESVSDDFDSSSSREKRTSAPKWLPYDSWMTPELREAFDDWHSHLTEIGYSPRMMQQKAWRIECQRNFDRAVEVVRFSISKGAKSLLFDSMTFGSGASVKKEPEEPHWREGKKPLPEFFHQFLDENPVYDEKTGGKARAWKFECDLPVSVRDDFSDWRGRYLRAKKTTYRATV